MSVPPQMRDLGIVKRIVSQSPLGGHLRVPHVDWAAFLPSNEEAHQSCREATPEGTEEAVYLVHSSHFQPPDQHERVAHVNFNGLGATAALRCDNITGLQVLPDWTDRADENILEQFLAT